MEAEEVAGIMGVAEGDIVEEGMRVVRVVVVV